MAEVSEEQMRRMEANRAAAMARRALRNEAHLARLFVPVEVRKGEQEAKPMPCNLFVSDDLKAKSMRNHAHSCEEVVIHLELCSPSEFFISLSDSCSEDAIRRIRNWIESVPPTSWKSYKTSICPVYKLRNYEKVVDVLKRISGVKLEDVPRGTRIALQSFKEQKTPAEWTPFHPRHIPESAVKDMLLTIPKKLKRGLLPFQWEGVRYGLRRGGRVLIADEMGVGKTVQAIAIASCYLSKGPLLVVCPASLRYVWAEELERWLPSLRPSDIHLVFGRKDDIKDCTTPKIVVVSYNMLKRLRGSMLSHRWETVIIDESHNMRCSKRPKETDETLALIQVARAAPRAIFLSGTPSLSRPFDIYNQVDSLWQGLLGKHKYEFYSNYCCVDSGMKYYKDFSKGVRLEELNFLLRETVMIRRLKDHVLTQLPPKRRQIIRLKLSTADISEAKALCEKNDQREYGFNSQESFDEEDSTVDEDASNLSQQEIGVAKLSGVIDWLSNNVFFASNEEMEKLIIFGHHHKILNTLQAYVVSRGLEYIRIDGLTDAKDRQKAIFAFRQKAEVKVAIVGVTAGGVGLDLSAARTLVFAELPKTASELVQAEDRAHRRGQKSAVSIYFFCAKDTTDESHWQSLNKSLERVSTMTNGVDDAIPGLKVESVLDQNETITKTEDSQDTNLSKQVEEHLSIHGSNEPLECDPPDADVGSLMFEVSSNTGRIHLFKREFGQQQSVRSLEENFRAEDLERQENDRNLLPTWLLDVPKNICYREVVMTFIREWTALRPVLRKKLYGRPLQLPLSRELSRLNDNQGGLAKGGSRRRVRPRGDLTFPLPDGASWREVFLYGRSSSEDIHVLQAWTADGIPLCKHCHKQCKDPGSKEPKKTEDLFCKKSCFEYYRLKTNVRYVREELFQLERGVCVECNLDCHALVECIRNLEINQRLAYILQKAPSFRKHETLLEKLVEEPIEGNAWHADHIIPVFAGGGECTLENMRTLCVVCHAKVTSEQCRRWRSMNRKAQRTLNYKIEEILSRKRLKIEDKLSGSSDFEDDEDDRVLLEIEVPGSSYSKSTQ